MSLIKEAAIQLIQSLPEDCTIDDIHYHLYVREKIEAGLADAKAGRVFTQAEAEEGMAKWVASLGQRRP